MKKIILLFLLFFSVVSCSIKPTEQEIIDFTKEYLSELSIAWSQNDEIFDPYVTEKYMAKDWCIDHWNDCNKTWLIGQNEITDIKVRKCSRDEYIVQEYKENIYSIDFKPNVIGRINGNKLVYNDEPEDWSTGLYLVYRNERLYVIFAPYSFCLVQEKDLPTLIERKQLFIIK